MKDLLSVITFSLKSIIFVGIIILFVIGKIVFSIDFETRENFKVSIISIVSLIILFFLYCIIVLLLYYRLPKAKNANSMGFYFTLIHMGIQKIISRLKTSFLNNLVNFQIY